MKTTLLVCAMTTLGISAGCTLPSSSRVVSRQQAGQLQRVEYGTVEKVEVVVIEGRRGQIGTVGGGLTGAAATGGVGQGIGTDLARAGGAIAGAVTGQAIEEGLTRKDAREYTIKLENGSRVVVTQDGSTTFGPGERVAVASGGGGARVLAP